MLMRRLRRDENGSAVVEAAFALPVFIVMMWMLVQFGEIYEAVAGMQQALGEGARYATLCSNPTLAAGCSAPSTSSVKTDIQDSVYGIISAGTFTVDTPTVGVSGSAYYYDLTVCYSQPTSLLLFPGPTIKVSRSKRVWIAATTGTATTSTSSCAS